MNATPHKRSSPQEVLILASIKLAMVNAAIATAKVREVRAKTGMYNSTEAAAGQGQ